MRLGIARFLKLFFASLFVQSSWSFFALQTMGFLFMLSEGLERNRKKELLKNYKGFFNTHPYMAGYIISAVIRGHERRDNPLQIKKFITISQTSFASAGDELFWHTLRPSLLLVAVITALKFDIFGPLLFVVGYNIFHLYHRARGIIDGYKRGWDVIYLLKSKRFTIVHRIFEILGALSTGFLAALLKKEAQTIILVPIALLFLFLLIRRYPAVLVLITLLFLIIISGIIRL